jgi:hypothetical protein
MAVEIEHFPTLPRAQFSDAAGHFADKMVT